MFVKVHQHVVAICDEDLLGKSFEDENMSLTVSLHFYGGESKNREEILRFLRESANLNLVGKKIVSRAIGENVINERDVLYIKGVPHAQVYRFSAE